MSEHNELKNLIIQVQYVSIAMVMDIIQDIMECINIVASFEPSEPFQSVTYESTLFRTFVKGELLTKDNTIDGKEPIETTITTPTRLVTQEPGESKLKVE